jgi:DNA topoisomerase-1
MVMTEKTKKKSATKSSVATKKASGGIDLVIVESPTKAKTLTKYLGKKFRVLASVGHIRDLPKSKLGIDIENGFKPEYIPIKGKAKVIAEIKKAAAVANKIYLAPDPDREGEAIAWHIAEELKSHNLLRVFMHEITEKGVRQAFAEPSVIDINKVNAQQARRVLDRIVGYKISPLLWEKVRRGLSAGRVQSVTVRLICEREAEVLAFVAKEYWSIDAKLQAKNPPSFTATLAQQNGEAIEIPNQAASQAILDAISNQPFSISKVEVKERKKNPAAPFTTSTLQQEAAHKLNFTSKKTMAIAQQLYEGIQVGQEGAVGLITYMRTDSVRISPDFQMETLQHIEEKYGRDYRPATPFIYKSKKRAQEAHEAIRPTSLLLEPDRIENDLTREQYQLYKLIYNRFVASQMNPAILDVTRIDISVLSYLFRATGSVVKFPGFTAVYLENQEKKEEEGDEGLEGEMRLPRLEVGEALQCLLLDPKQHFTQPPPRFNEASLVRSLEESGIGRPSTYAAIITTIQDRKYVEKKENRFYPTELGEVVNKLLVAHFADVVDVEFTARMEDGLDQVEEGSADWVDTVSQFYGTFAKSLEKAELVMPNVKREETPTDLVCEKCSKPMVIKWGRFGKFLACTGYPECKTTMEYGQGEGKDSPIVPIAPEVTSEICDKCGKPMAIKTGRFGRFLACTGYPECKGTKPITTGVSCPEQDCTGKLAEKQTKGRKLFYSCTRYPDCKFAIWDKPVARPCPLCHVPFLVEKFRAGGSSIVCRIKECGYKETAESATTA